MGGGRGGNSTAQQFLSGLLLEIIAQTRWAEQASRTEREIRKTTAERITMGRTAACGITMGRTERVQQQRE